VFFANISLKFVVLFASYWK